MAEYLEFQRGIDLDYLGVASRDKQAEIGEGRHAVLLVILLHEVGKDVALEVVDLDQRAVQGNGESLREGGAH